ncbi:MAG TPA: hypothetical protein VKP30_06620 [Polyangiaceae bacterium]|nr:hypothetical protein [Polyangiaceae bacterium]
MGVLRFGLLGFKIQVQPGFWLLAALVLATTRRTVAEALSLIAILFGSILAHEMGHAWVARRAGLEPRIVIHAFGGITSWQSPVPISRGRAIAIAIAGPSAGIFVSGLAVAAMEIVPHVTRIEPDGLLLRTLFGIAQLNALWSLVNLLPVAPFDGGRVLAHLLGPKRTRLCANISLGFGLLTGVLLFILHVPVLGVLIGASAVLSFVAFARNYRTAATAESTTNIDAALLKAQRDLDAGNAASAEQLAALALHSSGATPEQQRKALELEAWAALALGKTEKAQRAVEWLAQGPVDPLLVSAVLELHGEGELAANCLRQALVLGDERPQISASLTRLLLAAKRYGEAALTTIRILEFVSVEEARRVVTACREGGRPVPAAELAMALFTKTQDIDDLAWAMVCYQAAGSGSALDDALVSAEKMQFGRSALLKTPAFSTLSDDDELPQLLCKLSV